MEKLALSAQLENLESMIGFIRNTAVAQGFEKKDVNKILVAAEEALVNVISYAYPDETGDLEVAIDSMEDGGLIIEITDWGTPFDPMSLSDPDVDAPLAERETGGLGVYMMRNIMDEVKYRRDDERNILTLVKRLPAHGRTGDLQEKGDG